jgi:hypothetical protein
VNESAGDREAYLDKLRSNDQYVSSLPGISQLRQFAVNLIFSQDNI